MQKTRLPLSFVCFALSFLLLPVVKAGHHTAEKARPRTVVTLETATTHTSVATSSENKANLLYDSCNLDRLGLKKEALMYALKGQQKLASQGKLVNPDLLTVCDFSQSSASKRLYIIDIRRFKLLVHTYVAHGKNSGQAYARRFSNRPSSLQSSLGFYLTRQTYFGEHGLSLRLAGLDRGFNDKAEQRAVVVHGANYIGEKRKGGASQGRSFGCPAVPQKYASKVINLIKNGTCLFIYHPSKSYLHGSRILNG